IGRLASATSVAQAQAEIETINAQMRREHPNNYSQDNSFGGDVLSLHDLAVGGMRPALLILLSAVFLVLLIACANLTTMLLARAVGTGIIFGLASARPELTEALKEGGRSSTQGTGRNRLRNGLVIAEVALALVLLSGAGLLMKSFARLQNVNPGFNPRNALT